MLITIHNIPLVYCYYAGSAPFVYISAYFQILLNSFFISIQMRSTAI